MGLNNSGFAITGILYTVFVLFLMILLSVLSGLNIKRSLLEKNIENINNSISEMCIDVDEEIDSSGYVTKYSGKYTININGTDYYSYLSVGQTISIDMNEYKIKVNGSDDLKFIGGNPENVSFAVIEKICTTDKVWELSE